MNTKQLQNNRLFNELKEIFFLTLYTESYNSSITFKIGEQLSGNNQIRFQRKVFLELTNAIQHIKKKPAHVQTKLLMWSMSNEHFSP